VGHTRVLAWIKNGEWKEGDDQDALKCWNLERLLEAATFGQPKPTELTMSGLTSEVECEEQEPQQQTNVGNLKDDCIDLA
jgi:hypothetical protein